MSEPELKPKMTKTSCDYCGKEYSYPSKGGFYDHECDLIKRLEYYIECCPFTPDDGSMSISKKDLTELVKRTKRIDELELLIETQDKTIKALTATCKEQEKEIISLHHELEKVKNASK